MARFFRTHHKNNDIRTPVTINLEQVEAVIEDRTPEGVLERILVCQPSDRRFYIYDQDAIEFLNVAVQVDY